MTDEELVARFRAGDAEAFETLVERYKREVYMLSYRVVANHADAHDLSQEAFVRVYRGLAKFRGDSAFRTWLYRVVMNTGINHARKLKASSERSVELDEAVQMGQFHDPLDQLESERRSQRLRGAIQNLPPKQRETLILKVYKELRYTDIARVMSCSVGTAKANLFHAIANLRRYLAEETPNGEV